MQKLLEKIKNISINDAVKIEESDLQFFALKELYEKLNSPTLSGIPLKKGRQSNDIYLSLVVANSIICYQLSSSGEKYWEEFSKYFGEYKVSKENLVEKLGEFIANSKGNKRFVETKKQRLLKLKPFLDIFYNNELFYYENMQELQSELAKTMKQKPTDKTIVFAVKMFSYASRNYFQKLIHFPFEVSIPIDSRLTKLYEIYNIDENLKIDDFYEILAKETKLPPLHLDAVLWVNFERFIEI